jgi:hypothetical protein
MDILPRMQYMKATQILKLNETRPDGVKIDVAIWQLPSPSADRPHGIKYRLWAGRDGKTWVRYDNEAGKGDHKHVGADEQEVAYRFITVEQLVLDFLADIENGG